MNKLRTPEVLSFISQIKCEELEDVSLVIYKKIFEKLPNKVALGHVKKDGLIQFLKDRLEIKDEDFYISYVKRIEEDKLTPVDFVAVCYKNEYVLYYVDNSLIVFFPFTTELKEIERLLVEVENEFKPEFKQDLEINLLVNSNGHLDFEPVPILENTLDIHTHYNDDFTEIHKLILAELNKQNNKGLILLHGEPGTGKTTYLRHLIPQIRDKRIIYIGADTAYRLGDPTFMKLLLGAQNSVLVIEDAETLLLKREDNARNGAITNLLNISDGLLSDFLNIQIICTFNTKLQNIDQALMRKGRLLARYEFDKLGIEKADSLIKKIHGETAETKEALAISEIYNYGAEDFKMVSGKEKIGFNRPESSL